jgi:GTP-binding protein HflX
MCEISREIQRQIGLLLDRRGHVFAVIAGDARGVFLPELPRAGTDRLRGLRLVHTHLHDEGLNDDDLTDLALLRLDLVAAILVRHDGLPGPMHIAHLLPANREDVPWTILPPTTVHDLPQDFSAMMKALDEELARNHVARASGDPRERAILIHVSPQTPAAARDSLDELKELARSAGIVVVDEVQARRTPEPKYCLGRGGLKSTLIKAMQRGAEVLIFDGNLSASQVTALAEFTDLKILDRTQVILDIFAQHAVTREGHLQVELAQLRYLLPRLGNKHTAFSRLAGGIGGRGPGETKLEVDKRRVRDRIAHLEREVKQLGKRRELRRGARRRKDVPTASVVGYTNAGKSTLLNSLTQSEVIAEDALFATLNPVSRRLRFPEEREVIVTDTVGFIRDLPPDLMAAFRTTFEELHDADLLLHVVDASAHDLEAKYETVRKVLHELELDGTPTVTVLNKIDRCDPETLEGLIQQYNAIPICALDRASFSMLLETMEHYLWSPTTSS